MNARAALATVAAAALALASVACSGSGGDKAGGKPERKPFTLRLETEDDLTLSGAPEFAEAVRRRSDGSMRIELVPAGRDSEIDYERGVVRDVRHGKAHLGIVGVRVWDTMGVRSFQGLLAPFLVDSLQLERQVLASSLAHELLEGVERAGVVGVALLPGPLRRPFGLGRPLVGPHDYVGAVIGTRPGEVASTTLLAMRATPMNRKAFARLTADQRKILLDAGHDALAPELRQIEQDARAGMSEACRRGQVSFVTASTPELAALREVVQPVYDELERDPQTRDVIAAIEHMRRDGRASPSTPVVRCARAGRAQPNASALEGRWRMTWTRKELIAGGIPEKILPKDLPQKSSVDYEFADGRFRVSNPDRRFGARGRYTVKGDVLTLVYEPPTPPGYVAGQAYRHRWSIYRNLLTFSRVRGSDFDLVLLIKPWTRVR